MTPAGSDQPLGPEGAGATASPEGDPGGAGSPGPDGARAAGPLRPDGACAPASPGPRPKPLLAVPLGAVTAGVALCTVAATALSASLAQRTVVNQGGSRWEVVALLAAWIPLWVAGVLLIRRLPGRWALVACAVAAVAIRGAALAGPPSLSDDVYRYA